MRICQPLMTQSLHFTKTEVEFKNLQSGKAAGPDCVSPRLLKVCSAQLDYQSTDGQDPSPVENVMSDPGLKVGSPGQIKDYRPVALTSHLMKILE